MCRLVGGLLGWRSSHELLYTSTLGVHCPVILWLSVPAQFLWRAFGVVGIDGFGIDLFGKIKFLPLLRLPCLGVECGVCGPFGESCDSCAK